MVAEREGQVASRSSKRKAPDSVYEIAHGWSKEEVQKQKTANGDSLLKFNLTRKQSRMGKYRLPMK